MKRYSDIKKINTKYLEQIASSGEYRTTDHGTDFGDRWEEIEQELFYRQRLAGEKLLAEQERQRQQELTELHGRACTKCGKCYPLAELERYFSKVSGSADKYRSACRDCQAAAARERRELKRIPF